MERITQAQALSINHSLNKEAAVQLQTAMSAISEKYYCAGWLLCLEYTLWGMILGTINREWGLGTVTEAEISELKQLSDTAGGWWAWDDIIDAELFQPLAEWDREYHTYIDEELP